MASTEPRLNDAKCSFCFWTHCNKATSAFIIYITAGLWYVRMVFYFFSLVLCAWNKSKMIISVVSWTFTAWWESEPWSCFRPCSGWILYSDRLSCPFIPVIKHIQMKLHTVLYECVGSALNPGIKWLQTSEMNGEVCLGFQHWDLNNWVFPSFILKYDPILTV